MPKLDRQDFLDAEFPTVLKVLFSAALLTLGVGYVFAMLQIYLTHAGLDGKPGIDANDIAIAYGGNPASNHLTTALLGPMSANAPSRDKRAIIDWTLDGATQADFDQTIAPIIENRCMRCHDGSEAGAPRFKGYKDWAALAQPDTGMSLATLVQVSHIHLFGMTFIFFVAGFIFSHARIKSTWLKLTIIAAPFLMMFTDIASWYLTKMNPGFAWIIIVSGVLMALSFAAEWCISMFQMWIYRPKSG